MNVKTLFSYLGGPRIKILLYHSILDNYKDPYAVAIENFTLQMKWLADNGYNVISLKEALKSLDKKVIHKKCVVLTFDDGFIDFLENAVPVLNRYNFKATVFIAASTMGKLSTWRPQDLNRPLMDWESLEGIVQDGCSIGSHGLHHCDLMKLTQEELDKEVILSKDIIQDRLGIEVDSFSYPWGICSRREINTLKRAGYNSAVTVGGRRHNGPETNRFLLERISIEQGDSIPDFTKKLI